MWVLLGANGDLLSSMLIIDWLLMAVKVEDVVMLIGLTLCTYQFGIDHLLIIPIKI